MFRYRFTPGMRVHRSAIYPYGGRDQLGTISGCCKYPDMSWPVIWDGNEESYVNYHERFLEEASLKTAE
jgi:hypothetical protein